MAILAVARRAMMVSEPLSGSLRSRRYESLGPSPQTHRAGAASEDAEEDPEQVREGNAQATLGVHPKGGHGTEPDLPS